MSNGDALMTQAESAIRHAVRTAIVDGAIDTMSAAQIEAIEDSVCAVFGDKRVAWATAYVAGVTMAPEFLKRHRPAQPGPPGPPDRPEGLDHGGRGGPGLAPEGDDREGANPRSGRDSTKV